MMFRIECRVISEILKVFGDKRVARFGENKAMLDACAFHLDTEVQGH